MALFVRKNKYTVLKRGMEIDDAVLTMTESDAAKIEWPLNRRVIRFFWWLSVIALLGLALRVAYLNIIKGAEYQEAAERNSLRELVIPAPRGIIYDRFGKQLVSDVPSMDAILTPADVPADGEKQDEMKRLLAATFVLEPGILDDIFQKLDRKSLLPFLIKERVSQEEMLLFLSRSQELPGVGLYNTTRRAYADGLIFSHLLGYEGKIRKEELALHQDYLLTDSIGKQGIEKSYEAFLRGKSGFQRAEVDAFGRVKKELGIVQPIPGSDLILNIDADLQKKVFDSLQMLLEKEDLKRAAAIALDPQSGAVRALVSLPSFDNNLFANRISSKEYQALIDDPALPLFNRAISGEYPPGSTLKPVLAAAALAEGIVNEHIQIESRGGISIGKFFFGDWRVNGFTDIRRAIAVSSDVFFYSIGGGYGGIQGLGMERMKKYENLFGYGSKTNIDMPGEADGFIPDPEWKQEKFGDRWYIGDNYNAAIGQGFVTATPLQILNAVAAIANGGTLYAPRVASQIRSSGGEVTPITPVVLREDFISPDILRIVREGMRATVVDSLGTAQSLQTLPVAVAGKTGTAQFGSDKKTHGWFVSFAPYEHPTLAMIILVEGQGEEGYNAVPIAKEVYDWYFSRPDISEK
ncbi:MAG: penicillin-binding protein 2 [Candidatus Moranbacteria bacterium RIFCSPLOWO2_02_FULL_48_19]|nr:MAG: penicillin-binding protein 2 [Candidatus Moranbacteria bacterium RIFCSPLOWO2_02_FULL_48_19]OGI30304.1 MAG: penicillin-binding protein 2 [Candidatus Moranbacteria bacterium RIFCSPLOWO2_12_FULL_48_12]